MSSQTRAPVQDGELQYEARGGGEPILFIHGASIADTFRPLMEEESLATNRLINYHRRGYRGSTTPTESPDDYIEQAAADAVALLEHVGEQNAHVVGHSSGGLIALQVALDAPETVDSLILLEPAPLQIPSGAEVAAALESPVERYYAGNPGEAVNGFLQVVGGAKWRTEVASSIPEGPEQAEQDAATLFELELPAVHDWDFDEEKAETLSQPTLYVRGGESHDAAEEGMDLVRAWFPQTEDYEVEGATHFHQVQNPPAVAEGIADFLRRHQS